MTSLGVLFGTREPATPRNERAATCGALGSPPSKTCAPPRAAVGATTCRGKPFQNEHRSVGSPWFVRLAATVEAVSPRRTRRGQPLAPR